MFFMKKTIYFLPILMCLFVFSSCKKCKDCTCSQIVSQTGVPDVNQTIELEEVCDEDLDEIDGKTITINQTFEGFDQSIEQTCDCK